MPTPFLGDFAYFIHEVVYILVSHGPQALVERGIYFLLILSVVAGGVLFRGFGVLSILGPGQCSFCQYCFSSFLLQRSGPLRYYWHTLASPDVQMLRVAHCASCVSGLFRPAAQRLCIVVVYKRRKKGA